MTAVTAVQTYTLEKAAEAERDARCLDLAMELKWSHPGSLGMEYDPRLIFSLTFPETSETVSECFRELKC